MARASASTSDVFINCPFDDGYTAIFRALIFVIFACGFRPRSARELDDGTQPRIEKLYNIIKKCRYGIHDLSRTELDSEYNLPRFNMPLELGIFLGAKRYGGKKQKAKRALILDIEQYRYQRFVSDLAGMDIHEHGGDAERALRKTRDWLANVSRRKLTGGEELVFIYNNFQSQLPLLARNLGLDPDNIPYVDFETIVFSWLIESEGPDDDRAH